MEIIFIIIAFAIALFLVEKINRLEKDNLNVISELENSEKEKFQNEKYLITVKAEIEMYVDAENEDNAYEIALEELYENPDRLISDIEMNASIEDEDVL